MENKQKKNLYSGWNGRVIGNVLHVGGEMYQATYILYQVKGVPTGMIHTLNEIADHPPAEIGVYNVNEEIMHEYGLENFI